jgi:tRNA(Ile)-lysidine synthase
MDDQNCSSRPASGDKVLHPLMASVRSFLHRQQVQPENTVVAVSGGPDSVALLAALSELQKREHASGTLVVAHLNHELRGAESDEDEEFVRNLAARLATSRPSIVFRPCRIDIRAEAARDRENLESVARRVRYDWLVRIAEQEGARWIATGHTMDDQAETVLFRLLRGTGFQGLAGIAPRFNVTPTIEVIRPLLETRRDEVCDFLSSIGQEYRIDSSNADLHFTRNRIRKTLLPFLAKEYNPAIVSNLSSLAEQAFEARQDREFLIRRCLAEAELPCAGKLVILKSSLLSQWSRSLVREVLRAVWTREHWPMGEMGHEQWDRLAGMVFEGAAAVDAPGGIRARLKGNVVQIGPVE